MRNARGFTLIEALIAAAVLGLGMLSVTQLTLHSLQSSAASQQQVTALSLANTAVECWRSGPVLCPASAAWSANGQGERISTRQGTHYTVRATISPTVYTQLQALQVTVTWRPTGASAGSATDTPLAVGSGQIDLYTRAASLPVFVPQATP
jgi:prepilin-type N-terminal cleavage/methylation domain-containing protein